MDEFALISRLFSPLATGGGAAGLTDDVAILEPPGEGAVIVTTDALVESVHFLPSDPLETVAKKLVRVNVSDIVAKGARPFAASLTLVWPKGREASDLEAFAAGLKQDLDRWNIALIGGDTTSTPGPFTLSLTLHGLCRVAAGPVRRSGAKVGDLLAVSGVIGCGVMGLRAARGELRDDEASKWLPHYQTPDVQELELADLIAEVANSSIDISDGLIADAGRIAAQSSVQLRIHADRIPLASPPQDEDEVELLELLTGGDDYQALFTLPPGAKGALERSGAPLTLVGEVCAGEGVELLRKNGSRITVDKSGWTHF